MRIKLFENFNPNSKEVTFLEAEKELSSKTGIVLLQVEGDHVEVDDQIENFTKAFKKEHPDVEILSANIIRTGTELSDVILITSGSEEQRDLSFWAKNHGAVTIQEYFNKNEVLSGSDRTKASLKYEKLTKNVIDMVLDAYEEHNDLKDAEMALEAIKIGIEKVEEKLKIK